MTTYNLIWRVIINVYVSREPLKNLTWGKWNYNQNSNPHSSIPQLCERCWNRAGKGLRGRWLVPYAKVSTGEEEALYGLGTRRAVQNRELLWMQYGDPWPWCWIRSCSYSTAESPEPVAPGRELRSAGSWTSRVERVSTPHGGDQGVLNVLILTWIGHSGMLGNSPSRKQKLKPQL